MKKKKSEKKNVKSIVSKLCYDSMLKKEFWQSVMLDFILLICLVVIYVFTVILLKNLTIEINSQLEDVILLNYFEDPSYQDRLEEVMPFVRVVIFNAIMIILGSLALGLFFIDMIYGKSWSVIKKENYIIHDFKKIFIMDFLNIILFSALMLVIALVFSRMATMVGIFVIFIFLIKDFTLRAILSKDTRIIEIITVAKTLFSLRSLMFLAVLLMDLIIVSLFSGLSNFVSENLGFLVFTLGILITLTHLKYFSIKLLRVD